MRDQYGEGVSEPAGPTPPPRARDSGCFGDSAASQTKPTRLPKACRHTRVAAAHRIIAKADPEIEEHARAIWAKAAASGALRRQVEAAELRLTANEGA